MPSEMLSTKNDLSFKNRRSTHFALRNVTCLVHWQYEFYVHEVFSEEKINEKNRINQPTVANNGQVQLPHGTVLFRAILTKFFSQGDKTQTKFAGNGILEKHFWEAKRLTANELTSEKVWALKSCGLTCAIEQVIEEILCDNYTRQTQIKNIFTQKQNERTRNHMRRMLENLSGYRSRRACRRKIKSQR